MYILYIIYVSMYILYYILCIHIYIYYVPIHTHVYASHECTTHVGGGGVRVVDFSGVWVYAKLYCYIASACPAPLENCSCQTHTHTFGTRLVINESHTHDGKGEREGRCGDEKRAG